MNLTLYSFEYIDWQFCVELYFSFQTDGGIQLTMSLDKLRVSIADNFRHEWGSGRKHVSTELFESTKRAMEERVKLPVLRADEPVNDSYRVPLARNFRYCFYGLLSKKRSLDNISSSNLAR